MPEDRIGRAKAATEAAVRERESASATARKAINLIIDALAEIIGGESLRGLPNLATSSSPYRGIRVRATKRALWELPKDGKEVLCLNMRGKLVFAKYLDDLSVAERTCDLDMVRAEWAEDVAEAAISAINYHLAACDKAGKRYAKISKLNKRLVAALTEETE